MLELPGSDAPGNYKQVPVVDVLSERRRGFLEGRVTLLRSQRAGFYLMADGSDCPIRKATLMEVAQHCKQDADETEEMLFKALGVCPQCGKAR